MSLKIQFARNANKNRKCVRVSLPRRWDKVGMSRRKGPVQPGETGGGPSRGATRQMASKRGRRDTKPRRPRKAFSEAAFRLPHATALNDGFLDLDVRVGVLHELGELHVHRSRIAARRIQQA